jgi:repressor of nif and glnA expression
MSWPSSKVLEQKLLEILIEQQSSLTAKQIDEILIPKLDLSNELLLKMRSPNRSEIRYRLAWVRTKARQKGLIEKSSNLGWKVTSKGESLFN